MTVLVTGAAGLIGTAIVRNLLARGENVVALDRTLNTGRLDDLLTVDAVTTVQADITDTQALDGAVAKNGVGLQQELNLRRGYYNFVVPP